MTHGDNFIIFLELYLFLPMVLSCPGSPAHHITCHNISGWIPWLCVIPLSLPLSASSYHSLLLSNKVKMFSRALTVPMQLTVGDAVNIYQTTAQPVGCKITPLLSV